MRYLPLTDTDRSDMLDTIGAPDIDALFADVPEAARLSGPIEGLPMHASEMAVEKHMRRLSKKNLAASDAAFFLGAGAYKHHIPASVDHIIQRGEFLTAYTPYQPEIAQSPELVQMFEVAFSRRICCSRVDSVSTKPRLPPASTVSPHRRPGIMRTCFSSRTANSPR